MFARLGSVLTSRDETALRDFGIMSCMVVRYKAVVAACAALLCGVALAHFPIYVSPESDDGLLSVRWTPVQVGICSCRPVQLFPGDADVYGVAAGLLNLNQKSAVASLAPFNAVANNYFTQVGLIDVCEFNYAFEVGLLNLTGRNFGVSIGAFNVESPGGRLESDGLSSKLLGSQVGLVNAGGGLQAGFYNIGGSFQVGALNADGHVQIGLLNAAINGDDGDYGDRSACLQVGLLNYNPRGLVKWLPIFNFSRGRKDW